MEFGISILKINLRVPKKSGRKSQVYRCWGRFSG
jgi:hypothetical protein